MKRNAHEILNNAQHVEVFSMPLPNSSPKTTAFQKVVEKINPGIMGLITIAAVAGAFSVSEKLDTIIEENRSKLLVLPNQSAAENGKLSEQISANRENREKHAGFVHGDFTQPSEPDDLGPR